MGSASAAYDVLVVGAGPAGLAAAWRAANEGLRVAVVDDNPSSGGQIWRGEERKPTSPDAQLWLERVRSVNIRFIRGARIFQQAQPGTVSAETPTESLELSYTN